MAISLHRLALAAALALPVAAPAQQGGAPPSLGTVRFAVSCAPSSQAPFDRAVALLHHMTYPAARQAFERIAREDPQCAMAQWGIAMTLFQPLWPTRPSPQDLETGRASARKARDLTPATERERLFIAAAEAFFADSAVDYWERIARWHRAMNAARTALPDDDEVAAFTALSLLASTPADRQSRAHADSAAELLVAVLERHPDHPGAMHYLVHANDVSGRESEKLTVVRGYERVAPRNPHALHMPTHIYTRLGDWPEVVRGNLGAAAAALEQPAGANGDQVWDEFPHAVEYLVYAYLQMGQDDSAKAQVDRLQATRNLQPSFKTAFHLASTRARQALERHAWSEARALAPREPASLDWDRFPWAEAVTWFARGHGANRLGEPAEAKRAYDRLAALESAAAKSGEKLFERNIRVLRLELAALIAWRARDRASSIALMKEAAELEEQTPKHAVTPAPTIPAPELLGDLLLAWDAPDEALGAYSRSLELYPRRFNSVLGAARAARAIGREGDARRRYRELLDLGASGTRREELAEARRFLQRSRRERPTQPRARLTSRP